MSNYQTSPNLRDAVIEMYWDAKDYHYIGSMTGLNHEHIVQVISQNRAVIDAGWADTNKAKAALRREAVARASS